MSLRLRLVGLLSVLVLIVAGAAVAVTVALRQVETSRVLVAGTLQPASVQSRALLVSLIDQETGQRGFVLTGEDAFLRPYRLGNAAFGRRVAGLRADFRGDAGMTAAIGRVAAANETWRRVGARPEIAARRSADRGHPGAPALVASGRGKAAFDRVRARVADLQALIDTRTRAAQARDAADLTLLRDVIIGSRAVMLVIVVGVGFLLRRWILSPVLQLRARMQAVAAGRLDEDLMVGGPPEVAAIGRDAESMRRRIVAELESARAATEALTQHSPVVTLLRSELTSGSSVHANGLEIAGVVLSAEGVLAGDWWEGVRRPDGSTALVVADVSGHGAEAGLVAFAFKQRLIALLDTVLDLGTAFAVAARHRDLDNERFLSCLVAVVDPAAGTISWLNAGHPPGLVVGRQRREVVAELGPTGPLISSLTSGWTVSSTDFGPDDMLLACTDGVLEARDRGGEEFGTRGLLRVLRGLTSWSADEAVAECREAVRRFAVDLRRDDVTCVALTLAGRPERV